MQIMHTDRGVRVAAMPPTTNMDAPTRVLQNIDMLISPLKKVPQRTAPTCCLC
jgi:hypothetical protein